MGQCRPEGRRRVLLLKGYQISHLTAGRQNRNSIIYTTVVPSWKVLNPRGSMASRSQCVLYCVHEINYTDIQYNSGLFIYI